MAHMPSAVPARTQGTWGLAARTLPPSSLASSSSGSGSGIGGNERSSASGSSLSSNSEGGSRTALTRGLDTGEFPSLGASAGEMQIPSVPIAPPTQAWQAGPLAPPVTSAAAAAAAAPSAQTGGSSSAPVLTMTGEETDRSVEFAGADSEVRFLIGRNRKLLDAEEALKEEKRLRKKSTLVAQLRASATSFLPKFSPLVSEEKKPVNALPKHLDAAAFGRSKANSTSTLYVASTLANPDNEEILRCMAVALYYHMKKTQDLPNKKFLEIFSEEVHPLDDQPVDLTSLPPVDVIFRFVQVIFSAERLPIECAILCLSYIERIIGSTSVTIHASNWRRIVLSALILASKVWEDQAVWNVDFLSVFPNVSVRDLNKLEAEVLQLLNFNVSLHAGVYARYYFALRDLSDLDDSAFPLRPLDRDAERRIETRSSGLEQSIRPDRAKRAMSTDQLPTRSPLVILN